MTEKIKNKILPAVFILFIFSLVTVFLLSPKAEYSESEKRVLAAFPTFSLETLKNGNFTDGLEKYISDRFPFRDFFVGVNAYEKLALGQTDNNGVQKAKDGYLITDPSEFDESKCRKNASYIERFTDKTGLKSYVLTVPEAGYVLSDKLPKNHKKYYDNEIFEALQSEIKSADFVDVRNAFEKDKNAEQIYYKTDHHLTSEGAMLLYGEFCKAANLEKHKFTLKKTVGGFNGTTYSKSGLWLTESDSVNIYGSETESKFTTEIDDGKGIKKYDSLYFESHLNEQDKYPVFLDGNHAFVRIHNDSIKSGKKLLLVKDSYAHCFATYLAENYEEIVMVDLRYYRKPMSKLVENENFTEALFLFGAENISTSSDISWLML